MRYRLVEKAAFLSRPNRFIARVMRQGEETVCHVKNTGRCRELLLPGVTVYLSKSGNPARKTQFDLIAVEKNGALFNIDSQAPNQLAREWLEAGGLGTKTTLIRPEQRFGDSRLDFYYETKDTRGFLEVKGVTLEKNGLLMFPDAPTQRGVRHLEELIRCKREGCAAGVLFVVQTEIGYAFAPNWATHPEFGYALQRAAEAGVEIWVRRCKVRPEEVTIQPQPVPVLLERKDGVFEKEK